MGLGKYLGTSNPGDFVCLFLKRDGVWKWSENKKRKRDEQFVESQRGALDKFIKKKAQIGRVIEKKLMLNLMKKN